MSNEQAASHYPQDSSAKQAPQIPNLLATLRAKKNRSGTAPRDPSTVGGPSVGGSSSSHGATGTARSKDTIVQQTDDDAAGSRLSAVNVGYLDDPWASLFYNGEDTPRRMPVINRGTYLRTTYIDRIIDALLTSQTLSSSPGLAIFSLGAGTDTRPLRLLSSTRFRVTYTELDFLPVVRRKIAILDKNQDRVLRAVFGNDVHLPPSHEATVLNVESGDGRRKYGVQSIDLRLLQTRSGTDPEQEPLNLAIQSVCKVGMPVLLLAELSLTYMHEAASTAALEWFVQAVGADTPLDVLLYEPVKPDDAFGRQMVENLAVRGIEMPGMKELPSIKAQEDRLKKILEGRGSEFKVNVQGTALRTVWRDIDNEEKERLQRLEGLDEEEEWDLLADHYAFVKGSSKKKDR